MTSKPGRKVQDKAALRELFIRFTESRDPAVREELILSYSSLAAYLARKFANRGEPLEDLTQVAHIGLLKAVDRFDPTRGIEFTTYATVTIVGEVKRHFRDKFWTVRVPRRLRELNNALMKSVESLSQRLGRSPTIPEIANETGVPFEEVVEAFELGRAYNPASLDAELAEGDEDRGTSLIDYLGEDDPELMRLEDRRTLEDALRSLPERQSEIVRLRYYEGMSQADIARKLGISQMHVSRIQRDALKRLRDLIEG
ncbi:MAG TPA: SigB/SigF/SigG family RNA polymerase sigma factor [bacterium]